MPDYGLTTLRTSTHSILTPTLEADITIPFLQVMKMRQREVGWFAQDQSAGSRKLEFEPRESGCRACPPNHDITLPPYSNSQTEQDTWIHCHPTNFSHLEMLWRNWTTKFGKQELNNKKYTVRWGYPASLGEPWSRTKSHIHSLTTL